MYTDQAPQSVGPSLDPNGWPLYWNLSKNFLKILILKKISRRHFLGKNYPACSELTHKAAITTAADNKFCDIFPSFRQKQGMIFHENRLPADDSHEISCLICYFYTPCKLCLWWVYCFHVVRVCVRACIRKVLAGRASVCAPVCASVRNVLFP